MRYHRWFLVGMLVVAIGGTGCAAMVTAIKHKDLEVGTKMSETIFLDPVAPEKRTVWIEVKNTSDQELDLTALNSMVAAKGYRIVTNPEAAQYLLQVNVLFVGKASQAAIDQALGAGFGGPLAGAIAGAGIGAAIGDGRGAAYGAGAGALAGAAAEMIAGALVKVVTYSTITDFQLSERSAVAVAQQQTATLTQGAQTQVHQQVAETSPWKRYRSRVASIATKVNLDFEEAKPVLVERLLKSLAGIL